MPLTRSKRKTIEEGPVPTKVQLLELVKHNRKDKVIRQKSSENFLKIQNTQDISKVPLTQINASQVSSQTPATTDEVIVMLKKVRRALDQNFKNVCERLSLDTTPQCLYDLNECNQAHNSKTPVKKASESDVYVARTYLSEERHFQFFHFVRHCMCGFGQFPGSDICIKILQEILKYESNESCKFSTNYIIGELYSVFSTIIQKFPPCQLRQNYLNMFLARFQIDGFTERKQVLLTILDLIHDQIFTKGENSTSTRNDCAGEINFQQNFYIWDVKFNVGSSFSNLSRDDRFERLFMTLDLLVRILEHDMAIFMVKYSHKFGSKTSNEMHRPLICSTIWQSHESVVVVNHVIKKITSIYVSMHEMDYPADKIQIVSRLLSLVGQVINMYEYSDVKIEYPAYKNYTMDLSREIQNKVEASTYYSIDLYIKIITTLRSPLLKLLLAHHLHAKISGEAQSVSLAVPLNAIYYQHYENFDEFEAKKICNTQKYPVHVANKSKARVKVSRGNYLKLVMLYAEAFNDYYRVQSCANEIKRTEDDQKTMTLDSTTVESTPFDMKSFSKALKNIDLDEKVALRCVDTNYFNSIHVQLTKQECIFYRNEIKNYLILCKLIARSRDELGDTFKGWMSFTGKIRA